ncbi:hypothetical protein C8R43DRAFT_687193 [Mycena crocata]|nr:hypothetical protein C8R43DRAFT_687193 [Mycena crocata]
MHILADAPHPHNGAPIFHIVRDFRGDVLGEIDSPSAPAGLYPDFILQVAARLTDDYAATPHQFYDLWELVLTHWFPESEGYIIQPQWPIPYLDDREGAADITFAVLDRTGNSPVVLLQVSAPRDFHNVHTRAAAEALSAGQFEQTAPYCVGQHPLCALTAMGKKWMAFQRSPNLTAHEAREQALGEERIEWMDDIVSEVSYEMLECFFASLKEAIRAYRIAGT